MKFYSKKLGEFEFHQENIIYFPLGIPGFDYFKRYILLSKKNIPYFYFLHSIENDNLMFILTNPFLFIKEYSFKLSDEDLYFLEIKESIEFGKNVFVFSIVTIDEKVKKFSLNLKAPVIINLDKKIGKQVILYDHNYPIKYEIDFNQKENPIEKEVKINIASPLN